MRRAALAAVWLLTAVLQTALASAPGLNTAARHHADGRIPLGEFAFRALTTEAALVAVALAVCARRRMSIRWRIPSRAIGATTAGGIAILAISALAAVGMRAAGEAYSGLPIFSGSRVLIVVLLAAAVAAPAAEELFFREALLSRILLPCPRAVALSTQAILFGALHAGAGGPLLLSSLCGVGLALGWLRLRTDSLGAPIAAHAANNLAAVLFAAAGGD